MKFNFIIVLFLPCMAFSQEFIIPAWDTSKVIKTKDGWYKMKDELPDGTYKVFANNQKRDMYTIVATYKHKKKEGRYTSYTNYYDSIKREECTYKNGKLEGLYMAWYYKDSPSDSAYYKDGKVVGLYTTFGQTDHSKKFTPYEKGLKQGIATEYNKKGKKDETWTYMNDKLEGAYTKWDDAGNKIEEGIYKNDKRNGEVKCYYPSGKKKRSAMYVNDKLNGLAMDWFESGFLRDSIWLKDDKEFGNMVVYYDKGLLSKRAYYINGNSCVGSGANWYSNGQLENINIYDYIKLIRDDYVWNDKGVLIQEDHSHIEPRTLDKKVPKGNWDTINTYQYTVSEVETSDTTSPKCTPKGFFGRQIVATGEVLYQPFGLNRKWFDNGHIYQYTNYTQDTVYTKEWYNNGIMKSSGTMAIVKAGGNKGSLQKGGKWLYWGYRGKLEKMQVYENGVLTEEHKY